MKILKLIIKMLVFISFCSYVSLVGYYYVAFTTNPFYEFLGSQVGYAFRNANEFIVEPFHKIKLEVTASERQKAFFEKVTTKDPITIKEITKQILLADLSYAKDFTKQQILDVIQSAISNGTTTPLYYYSFYTTPYLYYTKSRLPNSPQQIKNPFYNPDKALDAIEDAAFKGSQSAQNLLSHYYEYGELFEYTTTPNPVEALAWKVNAKFQNHDDITVNFQPLNKTTFINAEIDRLNIVDIEKAHRRIQEISEQYPIQYWVTDITNQLTQAKTDDCKALIERVHNGNRYATKEYITKLYSGNLGIRDYEAAYHLLMGISDSTDPSIFEMIATFYSIVGNQKDGLNPYYNPQKSREYL